MTQFKSELESGAPTTVPDHVYQVIINVPPSVVWNAITDGDITEKYFYGTRVKSTWEEGAEIRYVHPHDGGHVAAKGSIVSIDPGSMIEMTFQALRDDDLIAEAADDHADPQRRGTQPTPPLVRVPRRNLKKSVSRKSTDRDDLLVLTDCESGFCVKMKTTAVSISSEATRASRLSISNLLRSKVMKQH